MAQHDFTPAWLNFPTAPLSAQPSQVYDKPFESPAERLDSQGDVSRKRHNSSDGSESVNRHTEGGYSRNGWRVRNGSEGSSSCSPLQQGGPPPRSKSKGLPEAQRGHRDDGDKRKQFEAEDFPSLNPNAEREVNHKAVATGVWEHPPNPQSRGSKMMVIKRVSKEEPTTATSCTATPQQQQALSRNGPSIYKAPIPNSVSLPVKASRSSSSSPVNKGSQPRLMMRLTRMRLDRKSHFLKALKQDMVDEEDLHHNCKMCACLRARHAQRNSTFPHQQMYREKGLKVYVSDQLN